MSEKQISNKLKTLFELFSQLEQHAHFEIIDWGRIDARLTSELIRLTASHFTRPTSVRNNALLLKGCATNLTKKKAQSAARAAVAQGILKRPDKCEVCGKGAFYGPENRLQAHHPNYDKPLDVKWLCVKCHTNFHKENWDVKEVGS